MAIPDDTRSNSLISEAVEAARRGDAITMVKCLFDSRALDGINWKVRQDYYPRLGADDVHDCVAEAVASCYAVLHSGKRVANLVGYVLKAARNQAYDRVEERRMFAPCDLDELVDGHDPEQAAATDAARAALRLEALRRARLLLPQLGQENIRRVMEVIFDAVEGEIVELTDHMIAEITGLEPDTVRRLKNRGFERLARLASDSGFAVAEYSRALSVTDSPHRGNEESALEE